MIYVMECGPLKSRGRECWLVLSLNLNNRNVKIRAMEAREEARQAVAIELPAGPIACCASLGEFGRALGWRVHSPPSEVLTLAAEALVGIENQEALGMLAYTPAADAWLRMSAHFMELQPWETLPLTMAFSLTFTGDSPSTRVVYVGGAGVMAPSLLVLPNQRAWELLNSGEGRSGLENALICGFDDLPGVVSETIGLAYGITFHPVLLRLRNNKPTSLTERELIELAAALGAVASLSTGRPVGRAVIDGVEAIALPLVSEPTLRN